MLLEWQILFPYRGLIVLFVIQLLSSDWLFVTQWTAARQTSLSFTISWSLFKLMSIELVMPSNHLNLYFPLSSCPQPLPASGSFPKSHLFASGGKNIGASASESVLPVNIQGWFPLGLTGSISYCPRDSHESSIAPQFKSIDSLTLSFLYCPTLVPIHDHWKNHSFDCTDFCQQGDVSAF